MPLQHYLRTEAELYEESRPTTWRYKAQPSVEIDFLNTKPPENPITDEHYLQFLAECIRFSIEWRSDESFSKELPSELEQIFSGLAKQWKEATGDYSVTRRRYEHPAYKAILELKKDAVPEILKELRRDPDRWFDALRKLTRANPAKDAKSFYEAVDLWIAWGISESHIS